jgi:site-specific DNA recombinase
MTTEPRAALYGRVSTEDQAERFGLASQVSELQALARQRGYTIPAGGEFIDDGASGADLDRPALTRLREAIRRRLFDVVLIHDPDSVGAETLASVAAHGGV